MYSTLYRKNNYKIHISILRINEKSYDLNDKSLSLISILFSFSILYVKRRHNTIGVITREAFSSSAMYNVSRIYTATESQNTDINNDNKLQRLLSAVFSIIKAMNHGLIKALSSLLISVKTLRGFQWYIQHQ